MRDYLKEFNQHVEGSNELYLWKIDLEKAWESGLKINKIKYLRICKLYEERWERARELLDTMNRLNPRTRSCMPPHLPPPLPKRLDL